MKGLRKILSPFAPDQSGAAAVFCELDGLIIICDAGGCAGNICGFDEPRWFEKRSAIFSAGLRDMDAILGRDDKLVEKIASAQGKINTSFTAVIGTPVPAVIATDYQALRRMIEKKTGKPAVTVDATGMSLYDDGASKAFSVLFERLAEDENMEKDSTEKIAGILGATPLDFDDLPVKAIMESVLKKEGYDSVWCYGMGDGLEAVQKAGTAAKNYVISPSGLRAARELEKRFGTPYEITYPMELIEGYDEIIRVCKEKEQPRVLIMHQQILTDQLRKKLEKETDAVVTTASWFMTDRSLRRKTDLRLKEEDQWMEIAKSGEYDVIIADDLFRKTVDDKTIFIDLHHFAVSGRKKDRLMKGEQPKDTCFRS